MEALLSSAYVTLGLGAMCAVLLVLVIVLFIMVNREAKRRIALEERLDRLMRDENLQLQQTYKESYDLEEIRMEALAMGMIPADRAETVTIQVQAPGAEPTEPHSFWAVLAGLFA